MAKNHTENVEIKMTEKEAESKVKQQCFVIMPIGDHPSHEKGHFFKIYRDLIKPAIEAAGFEAYRADEGGGSQNIQIDIIKKIIEAPMAICDLSTRNPNVLFELGIRQAFDLPVALIQESGTARIFDINTFNTAEYRSSRIYDEVIEDRQAISNLIKMTFKKHNEGDGINSIIRLIPSLNPAKLNEKEIKSDELIKVMFNQINNLSDEIAYLRKDVKRNINDFMIPETSYDIYNEDSNKLPEYLSDEDLKIYRMLSGEDGIKYTYSDVASITGLSKSQVKRAYDTAQRYFDQYGIDSSKITNIKGF